MGIVTIDEKHLCNIADAIREKGGGHSGGGIQPRYMAEYITDAVDKRQAVIDAMLDRTITEVHSDTTVLGRGAFFYCTNLKKVDIPRVTYITQNAFQACSSLETIDLPSVTEIGSSSFTNCSKLTAVILRSNTVVVLAFSNAFNSSPMSLGTGSVDCFYVPKNLVDEYKSATNWSSYPPDRIRAIEDYPEITGG